jgi:serine/threonine-protein kinase
VKRFHEDYVLGGRYRLDSFLASGGMGDVWKATDQLLDRAVAVKIMRPEASADPVFQQRFREEALLTAGLSHHNIATLFDYGEHEGISYLVMELVEGTSLAQAVKESGAFEADRVRSVIGQMALALHAAHEAGVVHRDVKPANVLLGEGGVVKLTDFGIARAANASQLTRTGETLGTPNYLSPEQAQGRSATPMSDLYSLGVIAHELLSGRRPFDRGTPVATALAHISDPVPTLPNSVPGDLLEVIGRCLAKNPDERPASAQHVALSLGLPTAEVQLPQTTSTDTNRDVGRAARLFDVMLPISSRALVVDAGAGRVARDLAALGHRVVATRNKPVETVLTVEDETTVRWVDLQPSEITLEALGEHVPFELVGWIGDGLLGCDAAERGEALRRLARALIPRGRLVVQHREDPEYPFSEMRDDFLRAGLVTDHVYSGWDLRPQGVQDELSVVVLSLRQ